MTRQSLAERARRRSKGASNDAGKTRLKVLGAMNAALRSQFDIIESNFDHMQQENIRYYHKLGRLLAEIREDEGKYVGNDGTPGRSLIEQALSTQARTLRACDDFAAKYTESEMLDLAAMKHAETNFRLQWAHVRYLLSVENKEQRNQWAEDAVVNGWAPNVLHERIKKGEKRGPKHGRGHSVPATVEGQFRQMRDISKTWRDKQQKVWNGQDVNIFTNLHEATKGQISVDLLEYLNELRDLNLDIADAARSNIGLLDRAIAHVTEVIAEKKKAAIVRRQPDNASARRHLDVAG